MGHFVVQTDGSHASLLRFVDAASILQMSKGVPVIRLGNLYQFGAWTSNRYVCEISKEWFETT